MKCKSCGDRFESWTCEVGVLSAFDRKQLQHAVTDRCRSCHEEIAHGVIRNGNLHFVGGSGGNADPSPWGENNVRHLEDAPADLE